MIALGSRDAARGRKAAREVQADSGVGASRISGGDSAWAVRRAAMVVLAVPFNAAVPPPPFLLLPLPVSLLYTPSLPSMPRFRSPSASRPAPAAPTHCTQRLCGFVRACEACRALAGAAAGTAAAAVRC